MTGVSLLAVVYYLNAKVYLIDASIMALTLQAIGISLKLGGRPVVLRPTL